MRKEDLTEKSKDYITEALFRLMEKKPFSEITVTEIARTAGVARATYYRNFKTKEDVIKLCCENLKVAVLESMETAPRTKDDYYALSLKVFKTFKENRRATELLLASHLEYLLLDFMSDEFAKQPYYANKIAAQAYAGAFFNVMVQWMKGGCKEPIGDLAMPLCNLLYSGSHA